MTHHHTERYYTNGFNSENVYQEKYHMVGKGEMEPHPNVSYAMYSGMYSTSEYARCVYCCAHTTIRCNQVCCWTASQCWGIRECCVHLTAPCGHAVM